MDIKTKYGWQGLNATALLETDRSKIEEKIQVAEKWDKSEVARILHEPRWNARRKPSNRGCSERAERAAERGCCEQGSKRAG